jgi:endonuclease/exonuclease/phosphatase family metal-dependent hydrolase
VLLLQGALRTAGATLGGEGVDEMARACGLALHYVASEATDAGGRANSDRGNAILSTLPLTIPVAVELPSEFARRVAVAATVLTPGNDRVRLVSVEVDRWSTIARTLLSGNQFRARQVRGLADGLDAADDDGPLNAATLVGGDFGSWDDGETALRIMRGAFSESPAWDRRNTRGPFASDHVFFRRGSFLTITVGHYECLDEAFVSGRYGRRVVVNYLPPGAP